MSFFIRLDASDFGAVGIAPLAAVAAVTHHDSELYITFDQMKQDYTYKFEKTQFVLRNPDDTITFFLKNLADSQADMRILKHCCTEHGIPILVDVNDLTKEITPEDAYKGKATKVSMKLPLHRHQLVHIGLIVEITPRASPTDKKYLLCDPQVGSGPP
jgi:hypothetical protein